MLSPFSWVCGNLAGEYQYGTFSIFVNAAVILIWKLPLAYWHQAAALSIAHLFALAMGAYLLARGRELSPPLALMVALVATLNGWMICWGASDWFGALAAFAWLPWSWWAMEKAIQARARWHFLLPAPFIYLLIAGGFPYTVFMLALVTVWLVLRHRSWKATLCLTTGWLLGLGLSAPAWMSLLEIAPGSRRSVEVFAPRQWLVPLTALPGLIWPGWTVPWHQFEGELGRHPAIELTNGGIAALVFLGLLLAMPKKIWRTLRWEIGLLLVVILLCAMPSAGMFRFSFRWLALFHVVFVLLAAEAFRLWSKKALGWLLPIVTFASLLTTYLCLNPHAPVARYFFTDRLSSPAPLDPKRLYLSLYPAPQTWYQLGSTGAAFGSVVRPGSTSMFGGVHLINGYSPVAPAGIARLLNVATHGHLDPDRVSKVVLPEAGPGGLLAQLGIDGLIVARAYEVPIELSDGWKLDYSDWEGDVYHRSTPLPPVRALPDETHSNAELRIIENSRQRVIAEVAPNDSSRPVVIIFSRPYFPGYHARLNDQALPVTSLKGLAPTVELPRGKGGRLELSYRPRAVTWGSAASLASLVSWLIGLRRTLNS